MVKKRSILPVMILLAALFPVRTEAARQAAARVLITKSDRSLYLFDANGNVMRSFKVSLGPNPVGHKEEEGDGRTPEGRYVIDKHNPDSEYYRSLHISYPSKADIARAKKAGRSPGGDIFIHGQPNGKEWQTWKYTNAHDWTHGCVAVENKEMNEIWSLVPDGTPVVIVP